MKTLFTVLALLAFQLTVAAQKMAIGTPVHVLDYDQLYSTFAWQPEVKTALQVELGSMADEIVIKSNEAAWPIGIASLDARTENRALMGAYTVFYITTLSSGQAVLFVPSVENSSMIAGMAPVEDIFFIISGNALEEDDLQPVAIPIENVLEFNAAMETLSQHFLTSFMALTTLESQEEEEGMVILHGSSVFIESAEQVYFYEDVLSATTGFRAGFVPDENPAVALVTYNQLLEKVEALKLSCCQLTKGAETIVLNSRSQVFHVVNPNPNSSTEYQSMVIEVGIEQGETYTVDFEIVSVWVPVIYIYAE